MFQMGKQTPTGDWVELVWVSQEEGAEPVLVGKLRTKYAVQMINLMNKNAETA